MEINNVFSPVPFYKNKKYWHSNKRYTYGQKCPIMMTSQNTLPFQLVVNSGVTLSSFTIKKADNDTVVRTVSTSGSYFNIAGESYNVIQVKACTISALPYGNYYYALTLSDGSTYISDIIAIISDMSKCIKITYKNVENLYFSSGHIDFSNDFVFELYLPTTIGKPEYEYEEELTKRLGYKFLESQVVNKVYKFTFPATEQMCDAYRFVRMCDYIRIDTYNPDFSEYDHYNVIYLSSEVDWLDNGDIASIETSFETDSIVQKLQDYSRTQLVNFYNALLSNSDEVLKFDDETIAQYYSNYIQSIDGKMIRQLDAVSSISDNTVIAIDENNGIGPAKKILLKPLITSVIGDELRASEVLQNFQAHIGNGDIHITAQERSLLSLFALDENGDVYLKDKRGFYSNSFISAKGKSSGGSSGSASALYQLVDIEKNNTGDGVQGAEAGKVLMYNGTKWYAGTVNTGLDEQALKTYLDNNKYTTTTYVDSKVSEVSTELNNLLQGALNNKVDTAFFARVFGLLDANGNEIAINDVTTVADSIKAKFGLWTEQYLSAKGKNDNTSGSASALYQLVDILSNATNDGVYGAETGKVLMYNGTKWYAGTVNTGLDEKALKTYLDANKYTTTSYVDSKVSAVSTKLDNFLEGSDTDGIINKWKELEAFLAGQTQTSTLAELLAVKADKSIKIIASTGLTGGGDLSSNVTLSLASSGVIAGTYTKVTVDAYGRVTTGATLSSSDIPNIEISQVNRLQAALNNKVDTAFFARVFGLLDANGNEIAVNDVTTAADSIKAKFGLWTEQYISAKGKSSSTGGGGGGASALYQLVDVASNSTNDGVLNATNGSVLMYNGSKWQAGDVVTDISSLTLNVNGSKLFDYNGKSAVTANLTVPTKLSQLTDDVVSGKYLPLSGGTIIGDLSLNQYLHINAWSGYGSGSADVWYDGRTQVLRWGNVADMYFGDNIMLHSGNYNSHAPSLTGAGASGTWGISITGNAATASKWQTARTLTLTGSVTGSASIDGSGNVSLATTTNHTHDYLPLSGGTLTGNLTIAKSVSGSVEEIIRNTSNSSNAYSILKIGNNAHEWCGALFVNSSTRTIDGGANTFTIRNDYGILRLGNPSYASYFDSNLGVGTSTPAYKLDVNGTFNATTIYQNGVALGARAFDSTSYYPIAGGTSNPVTGEFCVANDSVGQVRLGHNTGNKFAYFYWSKTADLVGLTDTGGINALTFGTNGTFYTVYHTGNLSPVTTSNVGSYAVTSVNGSGTSAVNLYLGTTALQTTSVTQNLTGIGNVTASGSYQITNTTAEDRAFKIHSSLDDVYFGLNSLMAYVWVVGNHTLRLGTNSTSRIEILGGGNVGIGTTSPTQKLDVDGNISIANNGYISVGTNRFIYHGKASSAASSNLTILASGSDGGGSVQIRPYMMDNDNYSTTFLSNGYVGIGTTSPSVKLHVIGDIAATGAVTAKVSSSDIRLKTDITDYKALSIIRSHKSIKYHWNAVAKANADVFNDNDWHYGLIAQEVQQDLPQMVSDVFKDYLVINYERLIPICWKGLQEVDDEVTKLKKKVRKLEMEIRELKQKEDRL